MDFITNHTKIIVTDRQTAKKVTLLDTKESVIGNVVAGMPLVDVIDDSLDSFTFVVKNQTRRKPFSSYSLVEYTVKDGEEEEQTMRFFVLFDKVRYSHEERIFVWPSSSKAERRYEHTVTCVELTKILEKIKIYNLNLTSKKTGAFTQFDRALNNALPVINNKYLVSFAMGESFSFLIGKPSRDFFFENTDLRTVLDEMLSPYNKRVIVNNAMLFEDGIWAFYLDCISMDVVQDIKPIWTEEEQGAIIHEELENNGQDFAGKIQARGYNSIVENPIDVVDGLKSENAILTDENASLILPFPISDKGIKKISCIVRVKWTVYGDSVSEDKTEYTTEEIDLTQYFIPQEHYDLLDEDTAKKYISYQIGASSLRISKSYSNWFGWKKEVINSTVLSSAFAKIVVDKQNAVGHDKNLGEKILGLGGEELEWEVAFNSWFAFFRFKCTYYPLINTVSEVTKPNTRLPRDIVCGVMDSQTEKTLDIDRHGKKLAGLIKRTGNTEYVLKVRAKYHSKLLPLMSRITLPNAEAEDKEEQNYVLYKREYSVYDNFIDCQYYFSQNYNAVQENAGVNREKHLFEIPLESNETPLVIHRYMVFSTEKPLDMNLKSDFGVGMVASAVSTVVPNRSMEMAGFNLSNIKYLFFQSKDNDAVYPTRTENGSGAHPYADGSYWFVLPVAAFAQDKCMHFMAKPLDNYSVSYSRDGYHFSIWGDGGNKMTYNRYVSRQDYPGEAWEFYLDWTQDMSYSYSEAAGDKDCPPVYRSARNMYSVMYTEKVDGNPIRHPLRFRYYKDRTQTPVFCLNIECVPSVRDEEKIIIGSAFCKNNNLVVNRTKTAWDVHLYVSLNYTFKGDEEYLSDDYKRDSLDRFFGLAFSLEDVVDSDGIVRATMFKYNNFDIGTVYPGYTPKDVKSFAFADGDTGEIYLAVNGPLRNIYMTIVDYEK